MLQRFVLLCDVNDRLDEFIRTRTGLVAIAALPWIAATGAVPCLLAQSNLGNKELGLCVDCMCSQ